MNCNYVILAQCDDGYISQCKSCLDFNFSFKNVLIGFDRKQLFEFRNWIASGRDQDAYHFPLPGGRSVVFPGPADNMFLTFNHRELDCIEDLFAQTALMLDVHNIIGE